MNRYEHEENLLKERDELRAALEGTIEHVEEVNLLLAEAILRGGDFAIADETFSRPSGFTAREALRIYEKFCVDAREKWNMPRIVQ